MPLHEYECDACGKRFEVIQKFSDAPVEVCNVCGKGPVRRLLSSPAIQFKGSGWYITDYSRKGKTSSDKTSGEKTDTGEAAKTETEKSTKSEGEKKSDTKKTESTTSSSSSSAKDS